MPKTRTWVACALIWLVVCAWCVRLPDLRPEIAELDGVHPVRAAQALRDAYRPGHGFLDKYPPLGAFVMGLAGELVDPGLLGALPVAPEALADDPPRRREVLWPLRDRIARRLDAQRLLSGLAMAAAVALVGVLAARATVRHGGGPRAARAAGLAAAAMFGAAYPVLVYGATTNVDALALAAALAAVERLLAGRAVTAGVLLGAAVATKDPAYAIAPALLAAAWLPDPRPQDAGHDPAGGHDHDHDVHDHLGGVGGLVVPEPETGARRRVLAVLLGAAASYLVFGGVLVNSSTVVDHARYLLAGGVESVPTRIDHGDPVQWLRLVDYVRRLLAGVVVPAWAGTLVVLAGLFGLARMDRRARALLLGAAIGPVLVFVLPVGFVYPRFLLPSWAMVAVGAGVLVSWAAQLARARGRPRLALAALALPVLVVAGEARTWPSLHGPDARGVATARLERLPAGTRVGVLSGTRGHGPVPDPARIPLEVHGLARVDAVMERWRVAAPAARPDVVLVLSFPYEPPDGRRVAPPAPPRAGEAVAGGLYRVAAVLGGGALEEPARVPERTLAWRPRISWLEAVR